MGTVEEIKYRLERKINIVNDAALTRRFHLSAGRNQPALCGAKPDGRRWVEIVEEKAVGPICKLCLKAERDAILASQSLSLRLAPMELIRSVPWRSSTHVAEHEYVVKFWDDDCAELIETIRSLIREHGYSAKFAGHRYRYVNIEEYRYFCFQIILNRARRDQEMI